MSNLPRVVRTPEEVDRAADVAFSWGCVGFVLGFVVGGAVTLAALALWVR